MATGHTVYSRSPSEEVGRVLLIEATKVLGERHPFGKQLLHSLTAVNLTFGTPTTPLFYVKLKQRNFRLDKANHL
jgi:hypothetical protein